MRTIYLNAKQAEVRNALLKGWKNVVVVAGRGMGKSTVLGDYLYNCALTMPRSRGWLGSQTREIIKNRSLPSIQEFWDRLGLKEGKNGDYLVGQKPPGDWERPYNKIESYTHSIAFKNGASIDLVSFFKEGGGRGANYQYGAGDEMLLVKRPNYSQSIIPAMRGNRFRVARIDLQQEPPPGYAMPFGKISKERSRLFWEIPFEENPYYMSTLLVSTMPFTAQGKWILEAEDNEAIYYVEGTALDNIDVLGPEYIPNLQRTLTDLEFRIEVMNERIEQRPDGFYHQLRDELHITYEDPYQDDLPLDLTFDFGAFSGCIAAQQHGGYDYALRNFYVKDGNIHRLMEMVLSHYQNHRTREVTIYGDVQGNYKKEGSFKSLYQEVQEALTAGGWQWSRPATTFNPTHAKKHLLINSALAETSVGLPPIRIHYEGCRALIASMKQAGLKLNMEKDKASEHPNHPTPAEEATHLSDAWDYRYYRKYQHAWSQRQNGGESLGLSLG